MDDASCGPPAGGPAEGGGCAAQAGRILLVDNFDSYTYNLFQYLGEVCAAPPTVIKNNDPRGRDPEFVATFAGVVISPGPGNPEIPEDIGVCKDICETYTGPILGVCLGFQALGLWNGATVCRAPHAIHGEVSPVNHAGTDPLFRDIPREFRVVRYHSLAIDPASVDPSKIDLTAATFEEGAGFCPAMPLPFAAGRGGAGGVRTIPMGLKVVGKPHWGVQFHPESICTQHGHTLVQNFARICGSLDPGWAQKVPKSGTISKPLPSGTADPLRLLCQRVSLRGAAFAEAGAADVFDSLFSGSKNVVWLDSSSDPRGRFSVMADDLAPGAFCVEYSVDTGVAKGGDRLAGGAGAPAPPPHTPSAAGADVLESLERYAASRRREFSQGEVVFVGDTLPASPAGPPASPPAPPGAGDGAFSVEEGGGGGAATSTSTALPFQGGFLGYLTYELRRETIKHSHGIEGVYVGCPDSALDMPDLFMLYAQAFVVVDHREDAAFICHLTEGLSSAWVSDTAARLVESLAARRGGGAVGGTAPPRHPHRCTGEGEEPLLSERSIVFRPSKLKREYIESIQNCQALIASGDTYEVCLTNEFECELGEGEAEDTLAFYKKLRVINAAPYAGYILVEGRGAVCSSSPERFLKIAPDGRCEAKPIKGTIRRTADPTEDARLKEKLRTSVKDQCENLMIADLIRNDLGMISDIGSVSVPRLMDIESYRTVHQMVTTVQSQLARGTSHATALKVTFPGGSIVGAPKIRTMSIIQELEGRRRGVYTGSLGYLSVDGASDFNIAIRTAVIARNRRGARVLRIGAGGAITILSDPEDEWDEIMVKAYPLMRAVSKIMTGDEHRFEVAL